jgi:hypothetical protein
VSACLGEDRADLLRTGMGGNGLDVLGEANREQPSLMERLTQGRVIATKVPRHRVELELGDWLDTRASALDLVEPGQHIAGIV